MRADADAVMTKVACIGECMIELKQAGSGLFSRGYGGDTLNTAVYLARLGAGADYITALGDDSAQRRDDRRLGGRGRRYDASVASARQIAGPLLIETDDNGERRFFHWRDSAAARSLMDLPETDDILNSLAGYDVVYLSAITLSLYGEAGPCTAVHRAEGCACARRAVCLRHGFPCAGLARPRHRARGVSAGL